MRFISPYREIFKTVEYYIFEKFSNKKIISKINKSNLIKEINKLKILSGPFKGMKYPDLISHGSAIFPKILGTYEREINEIVEKIIKCNYDIIIDVGCAEGYYAVGLALRMPNSLVFAYDTAEDATRMCEELSKTNNVQNRIEIHKLFNLDEYLNIINNHPNSRILLISDIEGAEKDIFNNEFKLNIKNTDFLIELHDFIDIEITNNFKNFLLGMLQEKVFSLSDFQKALEYDDNFLNELDFESKLFILKEGRPEQMKWIYATN